MTTQPTRDARIERLENRAAAETARANAWRRRHRVMAGKRDAAHREWFEERKARREAETRLQAVRDVLDAEEARPRAIGGGYDKRATVRISDVRRALSATRQGRSTEGDPMNLDDTLRGLYRGRARVERIRAEIEDRRPRIRRAAELAEKLAEMSGGEPVEVVTLRPRTVAGVAILRARRIQLRETAGLR